MNRTEFLEKIIKSTKRFLGTSLLVSALTVNPFLTENVQSKDFESKIATETAPEVEWDKTFGGSSYDYAHSVQQTIDGGYILAGYTLSFGAGNWDFWLIKTDSNGNKEWDKTFGESECELARSVQQTTDKGYIIAGYTQSFGARECVWLIKTDLDGNMEWDKTFGSSLDDRAYSVQQTIDGGYILAGTTSETLQNQSGNVDSDALLIKTDSNGNKEWTKTFGGSELDAAHSVQQTIDGGYILAGHTKSFGAHGSNFWLIKTDLKGNKEWDKTFGDYAEDQAYSVQQTFDGGYILAGYTTGLDFWLVKTDSDGNKEWDKTFKGGVYQAGYQKAWSVQQTSDNGYIMAGYTYSLGEWNDFWLIKTDQKGNTEWDKILGGPLDDKAYSVQQTIDGGYILAGYTQSFGAGNSDVWLIKLKGDGVRVEENQPKAYSLLQNSPNPFNASTTISFTLPASSFTQLIIYNITGQKVRQLVAETMTAGIHNVMWDGMDDSGNAVSSGVYISQLSNGKLVANGRMVLMK